MNNELLLLKIHLDTLKDQIKTKPRETLELVLTKQMEIFSISHPVNLFEEGKWLLAVKQRTLFLK